MYIKYKKSKLENFWDLKTVKLDVFELSNMQMA